VETTENPWVVAPTTKPSVCSGQHQSCPCVPYRRPNRRCALVSVVLTEVDCRGEALSVTVSVVVQLRGGGVRAMRVNELHGGLPCRLGRRWRARRHTTKRRSACPGGEGTGTPAFCDMTRQGAHFNAPLDGGLRSDPVWPTDMVGAGPPLETLWPSGHTTVHCVHREGRARRAQRRTADPKASAPDLAILPAASRMLESCKRGPRAR
jgi:hypothetical protein